MYYENYQKMKENKNVKDRDVARATGIDPATFVHWRKGLYTPKINKLIKIADYFGVPLDKLTNERRNLFYELVNSAIKKIYKK